MRQRSKAEYKAKVTNDSGLTRSRVPCPLLNAIGARAGDYIIFSLNDSGKVIMRLSRSRRKTSKASKRR